ncbi:MAG TPA: hypothetical protein HA360_05760 [Nanoarchaeota archaeon]|nr:hypothetical protein [Nanoarchaeota archaeon]HIH58947.1 hypothetical protein [Nanoarchaeota archaeon]HII14550.1 hypothetical protein [Nanoarchaeota archaeon]HIJ04490.1 hypothetical protein [Nanoarchaeota archaeon]
MIYLFSFALAEEIPIQILGAYSVEKERRLFASQYSCGSMASHSVVECYDLGRNIFTTRSPVKDFCTLYTLAEEGFSLLGSLSSCMHSLVEPVSKGGDISSLLSQLSLELVVTSE